MPQALAPASLATPPAPTPRLAWEVVVVALLWLQLFASLTTVWREGTYYDYGWFVAPIAGYFFWRRWELVRAQPIRPAVWAVAAPWPLVVLTSLVLATALLLARITFADSPGWRLPVWGHAAVVVALHHGLLAATVGWKSSAFLAPATLFALSAVPYPMRIEGPLVHQLADLVVVVTREVFLFLGMPVATLGERLTLNGQQVAVTDGCSGLRSFQSLLMAGLFFGELLWLSWPHRLILLALAAGCAVVTNTGRAFWLASTHFRHGADAMDRLHDQAGHFAFALGCILLLLSSLALRPRARKVVVRRTGADG